METFHDFTHTGYAHVVRRNSPTTTGPNYTDAELIQALQVATALGVVAAVAMMEAAGHAGAARRLTAAAARIAEARPEGDS